MNAILQSHTTDDHRIQFFNHPLPVSSDTKIRETNSGITTAFQIAFHIAFCMAFVIPFYVLFYVRERVVKSKHQQFISGAKVSAYWFANILWDFVTFLLTIICIIITLACFQEDGLKSASDLGQVFVILIFFFLAALPITYLSSLLFTAPSGGYSKLALINVFLEIRAAGHNQYSAKNTRYQVNEVVIKRTPSCLRTDVTQDAKPGETQVPSERGRHQADPILS
ncbi:hypothetical protein QE152_g15946 [Popillia japonica]|uniref:ABC-2 type transporter transmembrane domain-containing protein n=1 Tax=Popillia japonica TaxID=7064 RepID=A0AAW1L6E1_POPJA